MTTDRQPDQPDDSGPGLQKRPVEFVEQNDWRVEGWPNNPLNLPPEDRPIVGENLANLARQMNPDRPNYAAKQMLSAAQSIGLTVSKPLLHRFFALERDPRKKKPGIENKSGREAKDDWAAKTADYQAVAKAAFCTMHRIDKAEGPKWNRFEERVFEGTSFLPAGRKKKTLTNHQIVYGLIERLQRAALNTGIAAFWDRLVDTPFDVSWSSRSNGRDWELDTSVDTRPNLSDEAILSLGLSKLVRGDPLEDKWCVGDVNPDADLYWSEVSIELGRIAVPQEIWALWIPWDLRKQFTKETVEYAQKDELSAVVHRFPAEAQKWLLQNAWGGQFPEDRWDVIQYAESEASDWVKKTYCFECRLLLTVSNNADGIVQTLLEILPSLMGDGKGLIDYEANERAELIQQLSDPRSSPRYEDYVINENYLTHVIYDHQGGEAPDYWSAQEVGIYADELRKRFVLDELRLADAKEYLESYAFRPTIAVAESGGSRQFADGTVLHALFANLALGDCPQRIDRMIEAQAKAIHNLGTSHLDDLVAESDALLAELDKAAGDQP